MTEAPTMHLRGPIAYLNRETTDGRRVINLAARELPLTLARVPDSGKPGHDGAELVGSVIHVATDDLVVWGDAEMATPDPVGTRYGVGIDVGACLVTYVDREGNEVDAAELVESGSDVTAVFTEAELIGVAITTTPAWPDAYLEIVGPA